MAEPISIIIPAFNAVAYCRQCVHSVLRNTQHDHRLILVDNGSTDGAGEFFDSVPGAHVIHTGHNLGFAGGVNRGFEDAEGHVVLLNSDTLVPEGWLEGLARALTSADDIGMVGPMTNASPGGQQIPGLTLDSMDAINAYARDLAAANRGKLRDVLRLVGFCMMIRDTVIEKLGPFDEAYHVGTYEDDDYCLRVLDAGYRLCVAEDCFVFHYGGRTFQAMGLEGESLDARYAANREVLMKKWGAQAMECSESARQSLVLNERARAAAARGDATEALALLKEAIDLFPLHGVNYNDLGALLWRLGEHQRAFDFFAEALSLDPDHAEARKNLLDAAQVLGKTAKAQEVLAKCTKGWQARLDEQRAGGPNGNGAGA